MTYSTNTLLNDILEEKKQYLTKKEISSLVENKKSILKDLLAILSKEIPLIEEEDLEDFTAFFHALKLAAFFESTDTFPWVQKLSFISPDLLEESFGFDFALEELPYLIAQTGHLHIEEIKSNIENQTLDIRVRSAYIESLPLLVARGGIERNEVVSYFKKLSQKIIDGKIHEEELPTELAFACASLCAEECIEELKKLFDLQLIDPNDISLKDLSEALKEDKEEILKTLKDYLKYNSFSALFEKNS